MRDAAQDRKSVTVVGKFLKVRRQRVIAASLLRKKLVRQDAQVVADAKEPLFANGGRRRTRRPQRHCVQQWQRQCDSGAS